MFQPLWALVGRCEFAVALAKSVRNSSGPCPTIRRWLPTYLSRSAQGAGGRCTRSECGRGVVSACRLPGLNTRGNLNLAGEPQPDRATVLAGGLLGVVGGAFALIHLPALDQ